MAIDVVKIDLGVTGAIRSPRVAITQVISPDPSIIKPDRLQTDVDNAEKLHVIEKQKDKIRRYLDKAFCDEPDFIIFPELSIPWAMQDEITGLAAREKTYIIGGLTYGPDFENACGVFSPLLDKGIELQYKLNKAPAECEEVKTGNQLLIFTNTGFGTFAVVICYDFTSLNIDNELRGHGVNVVFLPTQNRSVNLFDNMATSKCYCLYNYICLCNPAGAGFGNSAVYGPIRSTDEGLLNQERVIVKFAGSLENVFTAVLAVPALLESIKRFRDKKEVLPGFIMPPADLAEPGAVVSPYTPLGPAKDNFVGRDVQKKEFWARVEANNHVVILGPSGTGKTSLIYRLRAEAPPGFKTGVIEVFDTEGTFDFLRRLSSEVTTLAETGRGNVQFRESLRDALDDIRKTRDAVAQLGFDESSKAFVQAFHKLAQTIDAQKTGKILVFIDQAERLAWIEDDRDNCKYAIRILIKIMRDLENLGAPVIFALAIRQHDYDPLIALACNHIPAQIVPLEKFSKDDVVLAIESPLPPGIGIDRTVSEEIAELSGGIPFFVQLLADAAFNNLKGRKFLEKSVFDELGIRHQKDIFPILMNTLTPQEQHLVEVLGASHTYTVSSEDLIKVLNIEPAEFKQVSDLLLGKNVIESLEDDRFRFVHDQMKGFIQREWLAAKMSNRERLRAETETALQMAFLSPGDEVAVLYSLLPLITCCSKGLLLEDFEAVSRILEQVATSNTGVAADFCFKVLVGVHKSGNPVFFQRIRPRIAQLLEKNAFYFHASNAFAIGALDSDKSGFRKALDLIEKSPTGATAIGRYYPPEEYEIDVLSAYWANILKDQNAKEFHARNVLSSIDGLLLHTQSLMFWPEFDEGFYAGFDVNSVLDLLPEVVKFAKEMGFTDDAARYYQIAITQIADLAAKDEEAGEIGDAARKMEKAGDLAHEMRDAGQAKVFHKKAGELYIKGAGIEKADYSSAAIDYKNAARCFEFIGDIKTREEVFREAIALFNKAALENEREGDFRAAMEAYANAAVCAKEIGQNDIHKGLFYKAYNAGIRKGELEERARNFEVAFRNYETSARLAFNIGELKVAKELFEKAKVFRLRSASENESANNYEQAASDYLAVGNWARLYGLSSEVDYLYGKAANNLKTAANTYDKLASFLISRSNKDVASALANYFRDSEDDAVFFDKVSAIIDFSRWILGEFASPSHLYFQ